MGLMHKFFRQDPPPSSTQQILEHLSNLLNTKQGFGAWQKGYGLKNYCLRKSREQVVEEIQKDITLNIKKYEKRVDLIDVEHIDHPSLLFIGFRIRCRCKEAKHSFSVLFTNQADSVKVEVES